MRLYGVIEHEGSFDGGHYIFACAFSARSGIE